MTDYDSCYSKYDDYFGADPEQILKDHIGFLDKSGRILDIGAGQGRHTLYLARLGYNVDALDPSQAGLDIIKKCSNDENLSVRCLNSDFMEFNPQEQYTGILVFGLIQLLEWSQIDSLMEKITLWLADDGLVFLTAWTVADPAYPERKRNWEALGHNSFRNPKGGIVTYLEAREVLKMLPACKLSYHRESYGAWHRHGEGQPERHFRAEAVFQKNTS